MEFQRHGRRLEAEKTQTVEPHLNQAWQSVSDLFDNLYKKSSNNDASLQDFMKTLIEACKIGPCTLPKDQTKEIIKLLSSYNDHPGPGDAIGAQAQYIYTMSGFNARHGIDRLARRETLEKEKGQVLECLRGMLQIKSFFVSEFVNERHAYDEKFQRRGDSAFERICRTLDEGAELSASYDDALSRINRPR